MKKILSFSLLFVSASLFGQENSTHCSKRTKLINSQKSATLSVAQIAETEKYDVNYYGLNLSMTNTSTYLEGTVEMQAKARTSIDSALFELFASFTISEIRVNGVPVNYSRSNSALKVPVNVNANEVFRIETDYFGTPPDAASNPLGGGGMTYDTSPSWGNHVVWSLSEPFSAYEWFPVKQSLRDKIDSCSIKITVPDSCKAGSNGILENVVNLGNGFTRYEWKHRHPIEYYLISVAVAKYVEHNLFANPIGAPAPILIQNFIYDNPQTLPNFLDEINETADFIELFYDLYGPYPFEDEKYGHCMAPLSGGMEHQTMTTQGFFEKTLTSHELGHQWWGDNVTCASWSDIWVNEGFASYSEYLMLENLYPNEKNQHMTDVHNNVMSQVGGSVWFADSLNTDRIFSGRLTYDKGAAIIHSLRYVINNDSLFFNTLRAFQTEFADSVAVGIDVRNKFMQTSTIDLTPFFEQWYFGEGYPTYSIRYKQEANDLILQISHTASKPTSTPTFTNPIDVRIFRQGQTDTIIRFEIASNTELFVIPNFGTATGSMAIDPKNWIVNKVGTITMDNTIGLTENQVSKELQIVPNPNNGVFSISNLEVIAQIEVYQMNGKKVLSKTYSPNEQIDLRAFGKGTYLVEIQTQKGSRRLKLVSF
ncbi:MAG: T9SS type A sorting domain-containing protein [Flavobacteriales bacterium]|nr:T9SS type A sorting domain-containing protein [Flavobacteriales bacterium]